MLLSTGEQDLVIDSEEYKVSLHFPLLDTIIMELQ